MVTRCHISQSDVRMKMKDEGFANLWLLSSTIRVHKESYHTWTSIMKHNFLFQNFFLSYLLIMVSLTSLLRVTVSGDLSASLGATIQMRCTWRDTQKPLMIIWRHNGTVILSQSISRLQEETDRYLATLHENSSVASLYIHGVKSEDKGGYSCHPVNSESEKDICNVLVIEYPRGNPDFSDTDDLATQDEFEPKSTSSTHVLINQTEDCAVVANVNVSFFTKSSDFPVKTTQVTPKMVTGSLGSHGSTSTLSPNSTSVHWIFIVIILCILAIVVVAMIIAVARKIRSPAQSQSSNLITMSNRSLPSVPVKLIRSSTSRYSGDQGIYNAIRENVKKNHKTTILEIALEDITFDVQIGKGEKVQSWRGTFTHPKNGVVTAMISSASDTNELRLYTEWFRYVSNIVTIPAESDNIVLIYGLCLDIDNIFLVKEYLSCGSLADHLNADRSMNMKYTDLMKESRRSKFISFTMDIIRGMNFLNSNGWAHPGLCSSKILLSADQTCKLYDFCTFDDVKTKVSAIIEKRVTKLEWIVPPETLCYREYNYYSDVWTVGTVIWEIFSMGIPPDEVQPTLLNASAEKVPSRMSFMGNTKDLPPKPAQCPYVVYKAITLCWSRDPLTRPSFRDLTEYLESALSVHNLTTRVEKKTEEKYLSPDDPVLIDCLRKTDTKSSDDCAFTTMTTV
ncbi:uncharacterized protein [Apostichopus japonicus]|uniref:uncharacterized protein isoform X2 n=1 Tax=Stichopus japonicus TaxID=307972 RepID=UPI003AB23C18